MDRRIRPDPGKQTNEAPSLKWFWLFATFCALTLVVGLLRVRHFYEPVAAPATKAPTSSSQTGDLPGAHRSNRERLLEEPVPLPKRTAEEIVTAKLARFVQSRREFALALARRHHVQMPAEVERFFAAVESGKWDDIKATFDRINGGDSSASGSDKRAPEVSDLWPAIIDAYGVAEQVHLWPAQQLLDYGNAILGSLRPGMVYVGGTDNGRWIPELLNETSDGEQHIVITQNGLAASDYLDYVRLQYDGQMTTLSDEDSKRAFAEYVADAQKRLEHDQQFPNEPKQVLPGENISMTDGKVQVGGVTAVMGINEKLLQMLMQKNPDLSFGIQESYPLKGTYADALPLGPLMELRAQDDQNTFTSERAAQTIDYWRNTAQEVLWDPQATGSDAALRSYSHDSAAAANLLAAHGFSAEAAEAYRLAGQLCPYNPESVAGLADLLVNSGQQSEARQLLNDFAQKYPDERKNLERSHAAWHLSWTAAGSKP